ncbi:hypothetical protein [Streptomyces sp. DSM 118148]|uniref:hypothetical protein n=1 Tax=Streptomyces sp. DSM 118148 TaxID=3448667 RepID=UPI00403FE715
MYGVFALPMFLTGAGAILINTQLLAAPMPYVQYTVGQLVGQAAALVAAGTVAGVVGTALWRAAIHAVLTGRRAPSGIRAGLWLGAGMTVGSLISGQGTIAQFFPSRSTLLLQFLLGGPAFTRWTAQCAQLWVRTWRGRTLRHALAVSLAAGGLALAQWFTWGRGYGVRLAAGWWYDPAGFRQWLEQVYPGPAADHRTMLSAIALVSPFMLNLPEGPRPPEREPLEGGARRPRHVVPRDPRGLPPQRGDRLPDRDGRTRGRHVVRAGTRSRPGPAPGAAAGPPRRPGSRAGRVGSGPPARARPSRQRPGEAARAGTLRQARAAAHR